ncbi:auxin efflux carrier [Amanita rubescens]|nr:auxin efflux carrier [Amanita rubescens]
MGTSDTPIFSLLHVVFASILEVFILCLAGYILAGRGVLDKKTQKQINRLNVSLFTPALLFSKVAFFLTPKKLQELWIIPIFFVTVTLTSMGVAFTIGSFCKLKKSQRSFAMAAAMFMNSNSLPIALMQSLVVTVPDLKWGKSDNENSMLGRALTYLVLYSTLGMVVRWSYGVKLLSQADEEIQEVTTPVGERRPLLAAYDSRIAKNTESGGERSSVTSTSEGSIRTGRKQKFSSLSPRGRMIFYSFPNTPTVSRSELAYGSTSTSATVSVSTSDVEDSDSESGPLRMAKKRGPALPAHVGSIKATVPQERDQSGQGRLRRTLAVINEFMTAPLWAAAASLIIACIPPLQHAAEYHMQPVKGAITTAGKCSIPLTLIVLGAYFYPTPSENENVTTARQHRSLIESFKSCFGLNGAEEVQPERHPGESKTVFISIISRMFITPLILIPLMAVCAKFGVHNAFAEYVSTARLTQPTKSLFLSPVFVVSNVLLLSSPPALTLAQITQAASGDAFERLISGTIFWSYCIVTPPMMIIYVVTGLVLAQL